MTSDQHIELQHRELNGLTKKEIIAKLLTELHKIEKHDFEKLFGARKLDSFELGSALVLVKEAAKNAKSKNILVASMPKSGSSFISNLFLDAGFSRVHLNTICKNPTEVGLNEAPQSLDELALIRNNIAVQNNLVAQHHLLGSTYIYNLLTMYGWSVIVTFRNIFDCVVSLCDMAVKQNIFGYPLNLPSNYMDIPRSELLSLIAFQAAPWYINFYKSWRDVAKLNGNILLINYDEYISISDGDKKKLLFLLQQTQNISLSQDALYSQNNISDRFNRGISGRGLELPSQDRERIKTFLFSAIPDISSNEVQSLVY